MNILLFTEKLMGGGEKITLEVARHMAKNHNVYLITGMESNIASSGNMEVINFSLSSNYLISSIGLFLELNKLIKNHQIDVVYVLSYKWLPTAKLAASLNKTPVIAFLASFITKKYSNVMNPISFHINRFLQFLFLQILSNGDIVLSPSQFTKHRLESITRAKVEVVRTFIDDEEISEAKSSEVDHVGGEKFFILYVGRLVPVKNLDNFSRSLKRLNRDYRLVLVGDGPERNKLEKLVEDLGLKERVVFLGNRPHKEALSLMNACDVLVLPSLMEQFPNVVIEGLSLEKPVIATNVGGIPEINSPNLYVVDDLDEMIDLLQKGVEGVEDDGIRQHYSKNKFHERVEELFESTVNN
ncbi:MAG: glycosyltransferase [Archaeoglobaceae archaeon]